MIILDEICSIYTIEKSEFITYLKHVKSEDEYKEYLNFIKKKHHDASHVCSAFICGQVKRSLDDGEPSGTAGRPILSVLEKCELDEICALVVRYFGGIKLGANGLTRAYSYATSSAIEKCKLYKKVVYKIYSLKLPYDLADKINFYLKQNTLLIDTKYDEEVEYIFGLLDENQIMKIIEYTKGIKPMFIKEEIKEVAV